MINCLHKQIERNQNGTFQGWGIMYQTDKTMDEDWLVLNKDGDLKGYFTLEHKKHYYPSEELATKAMKEFIVQRCVEEYEYLLRRDLLSIWGGGSMLTIILLKDIL